ncbi:hypothetical protein AGMMS50262_00680 [Bacteroidia bacterium]|nr:hypothetical protein AGMMS50262_00680 [Bacteroidia bacterium]
MSHLLKIREDKRCQNCGHFVAERFCPECGQENTETRQRFHYLFVHFFEDFVHYDAKFWKTIFYLLFYPAKLTKEYLAGKRKSFVQPVQLYLFISFVVFFIPAILPHEHSGKEHLAVEASAEKIETEDANEDLPFVVELMKGLEKDSGKEFFEMLKHHFPKVIFLYMPVFAFWLWVFHNKKKWFYFDHGIYTLHYFSFILLSSLIYILVDWTVSLFHYELYDMVMLAMWGYFIYYFFHSHRLMYGETKAVSRLKCTLLFFINSLCMLISLIVYLCVIYLILKI